MVVLTTNCFKVENDFEKIGGENCGSKSNGYEPEYYVDFEAYVKKFSGRRCGSIYTFL